MHSFKTFCRRAGLTAGAALLGTALCAAQTRLAVPQTPVSPTPGALNDQDVASTQSELIKLLRLSPTLTTVVAHDPSLLSNQEYVAHNNPQLAQFLASHPEVARNPDYFLFSHLAHGDGSQDEALERAVWPDVYHEDNPRTAFGEFVSDIPPLLAFAFSLLTVAWLVRVFLENRRWNRIFKLQSDVHGRLIDKFSTSQELAAYMGTDAGRKFLEAAPIPMNFETSQKVPNAVARVLTPLQIGIVLSLLGAGLYGVRHASAETELPMLILSVLLLMPGLGFIISAGITWLLAARLGLMPTESAPRNGSPYGLDRQ